MNEAELPEFTLDQKVDHREGKFDRIQIDLGPIPLGIEHASKGQLFANHLSIPPLNRRAEDCGETFGRLFCRYTGRQRFELRVRKESLRLLDGRFERPLFSGSVTVRQRHVDKQSVAYGRLCLNPTRFLRYQKPRGLYVGTTELSEWKPKLFADPVTPMDEDEFSFDENDNWISPSTYNRAAGQKWSIPLLRAYVKGVLLNVFSEIQRASKVLGTHASFEATRLNLQRAEFYWEFADPNPVTRINQILTSLGTLSTEQTWKRYRARYRGQNQQTVIYGYKLSSGVWLYIYAKTNERIRFEVRYNLKKASKILGGSHLSSGYTALIKDLQVLRKDAAKRLQQFFEFLREEGMPSKMPVPPTALITRLLSIVGAPLPALTILEKLVHEKGIPSLQNSSLKRHLRRLTYFKIVQCRNGVYRLTRDYRAAACALEQADLLSLAFPNIPERRRK